MSRGANIISAIQNLKMAQEQFQDFIREFPESQGSKLFIRDGIKIEIKSDVFTVPAILEKIALLKPGQ